MVGMPINNRDPIEIPITAPAPPKRVTLPVVDPAPVEPIPLPDPAPAVEPEKEREDERELIPA